MRGTRMALRRGYLPFLIPGLLLFAVFIALPFLANVAISFTKWTGVGTPSWIGLANYRRALKDGMFWASFRNNLLLIISVTVIPTICGLVLGVFLFDYVANSWGKGVVNFFRAAFYLPQILPVVVTGIVWGWMYNPSSGAINWILRAAGLPGLARNWLGSASTALPSLMAIMSWAQLGYPLVIIMAALQRIDPEILEAAAIDGARWRHRFGIITRLILPELLVIVLTTTIYALKIFGQIYVLTRGGPGASTLVPSYFAYQNFFEKARVGYGATISTIMTLIIAALTTAFIGVQARQERRGGA